MSLTMTVFLALGFVGVVLLLASLLLGDLFDGLFSFLDGLEVDLDAGGLFSLPVFAAVISAFGFGGALALSASGEVLIAGLIGGLVSGVALGWVAWRLTRALMGMATDATPTARDLVGTQGKVVTPVLGEGLGFGEVLVRQAGQPVKLSARAATALPVGEPIVVVEVVSPTSVYVESAATFWKTEEPGALAAPGTTEASAAPEIAAPEAGTSPPSEKEAEQ